MKWRPSSRVTLPAPGFIEPCIPSRVAKPPIGDDWIFEVKLDGYRLMVRRDGNTVRIYSRRGADFTARCPLIVEAARKLPDRSFLIDGEGVVYNQDGMPDFALIHSKQHDRDVSLVAFDMLEINGTDLRKLPLVDRKKHLSKLLARSPDAIEYGQHLDGDGADIYRAACALGHEGIVAKRIDLPYESGRSKRWLKIKNPDSPAMQRVRNETF